MERFIKPITQMPHGPCSLISTHSPWDETLLKILNVPKAILPEVCPSASNFGTASFYRNFWLETFGKNISLDGIPITGIAGDQQAALFGQLCLKPGMAKNTYGTGCFLMLNTGTEKVSTKTGLLTTLACSLDETPLLRIGRKCIRRWCCRPMASGRYLNC